MAIIEGPAPEALSNAEIIRKYPGAIEEIIKAATDPTFDYERQIQINQARLIWQFIKGNHFSVPGQVASPYGEVSGWVPFDASYGSEQNGADVKLCPPINVIGGDCFKFMAVMGQNAPRVKGVADDPEDPDSLHAGHCADVNIRDLWVKAKIDRKWKDLAFHQYATGPCFIRCYWNTDARKYGQSIEPKIEVQVGPDGVPAPVQVGETAYANGDAEISTHSVLEVSVPWEAKSLDDDECEWLRCERMQSKWTLLDETKGDDGSPSPLEKYRDADLPDDEMTGSSTAAAEAREGVSTPSGTGRSKKPNSWRRCEWWVVPSLFQAITNPEAREVFQRQFTDGLYVFRAGSITVKIDNRSKTDEWAVCRVARGEKIMERPIGADGLPIQRTLDDLTGMAIETVLRAITQTIMDSQLIDREAMSTKEAVPAEIILTALPVDGDINKRFAQIPPARLSDQVLPLWQALRTIMQDITGIRPELTGGGQPTQTFREAKQRKDQALAQLAPQAQEMQDAAASVADKLVRLRAKFGTGTVKAQRKSAYGVKTDVVDMAQLREDGWHAEADDNFPMTLSDRRDAVYSMLKEFPPEVQQMLSILDPMNAEEIFELLQIPGFSSAVMDQKEKTLGDIKQLLAGQPMPGAPGPDGQPGPKQPSLAPDPYDNHSLVAGLLQKWLVANQKIRQSNPAGFENVESRQAAEQVLATPPPPPPPPPIKPSLSISAKMEDFPSLLPEILVGAGLPAPAQPPQIAPAPTSVPNSDLGKPASMQQASPVAPLPGGPEAPNSPESIQ